MGVRIGNDRNMIKKNASNSQAQRGFSDLVGIDFATTATKVVRLKQVKGDLQLAGIDLLPSVNLDGAPGRLDLPRNLTANYGCLSYTGKAAVVRMINTPLSEDGLDEESLRGLLNVGEDYRASAKIIKNGKGRQDSSMLAAAVPDSDARHLLGMFPAGPPAPASLEVAGLSFVSAFLHARGHECRDSSVCLLEAGESLSHFAFLNRGEVALVGKMPFGAKNIRNKLAADLGVDDELAASILDDRSINISASLSAVLDPFIKQISISKDFIERHQGNRLAKIYVSGGLSLMSSWTAEVGQLLQCETVDWSPLENLSYDSGTVSEEIELQATRFAAAIGAAIGGFEEQ